MEIVLIRHGEPEWVRDGLNVVESLCGHDGFLVETEAVGELIRQTLELAAR